MLNILISKNSIIDLIESVKCHSHYRNSNASELENAINMWSTLRHACDWTKEYKRTCCDEWVSFEPKYTCIPMNNVSKSDVVKLELQTEVDINKLFELLDK